LAKIRNLQEMSGQACWPLLLMMILGGCASLTPSLQTSDFLAETLSRPIKTETSSFQSRYWAHRNFLIHFISNVNEQNRQRPPIIYVHGLGASLEGYSELIKMGHSSKTAPPFYAIDLPPFGRSVMKDPEASIHDYSEMLKNFVATLSVSKVSLVCHSWGGQICIDFALNYPNQIGLLTLISPAGVYDKTAFINNQTHRYMGINVGSVEVPGAISVSDLTWYDQKFTRRMITNNPLALVGVESFRDNSRARVKNLKTKTLILWGREDKLFSYENGLFLKENIENSTLYVIDGAGHTPLKTHAAFISSLIRKQL
jgi:pimeloyl-ACP methyl ester carboxylesterase